jgi:hypothetical protein
MTMAEKQLAEQQLKLIERTKKAAYFHRELGKECNQAGLPILAREHDFAAKTMENAVANQMRAFRDDTWGGPAA